MEQLNQWLFLYINASPHAPMITVIGAKILAEGLIWLVPLGLVIAWLRGTNDTRLALLRATFAGLLALLINQVIVGVWFHPRPFALGIGQTLLPHAMESSFPSDHLTLIWAVAFSLLLHPPLRRAGGLIALLGVPVAWARIYLGVHFPLDMLGAALVALSSAWAMLKAEHRLVSPCMQHLLPVYRMLFAGFIRRGWARQ